MKIVVFCDEPEKQNTWHGAQLKAAFATRSIEPIFVSLQDCLLDFSGEKPQIKIPHIVGLPQAVFVRGVAGGTLQQITTRLNVLHMLKVLGAFIYNDGRVIERTVDKAMTSFLLRQHGIATPQTWVCESRHVAHEIIQSNQKLVIKPLFGSQGTGVRLANKAHLPLPMDAFVDGVFYLQEFIAAPCDYRVFIVGNQVVAAMKRSGDGWLHNVAQGASCEKCDEADVLEIALQAAQALEIGYCGVDVIGDRNGQLFVLEVNSIPAWRGLQSVTSVNIAQTLVDDFLSKIN